MDTNVIGIVLEINTEKGKPVGLVWDNTEVSGAV